MKYIDRRAVGAWAVAGVLLLAWSGISAGLGAGSQRRYEDELAVSQERAHFWRVVAGQESAGRGPSEKLAHDLRLALQKGTDDEQELRSFRGNSTAYGGITSEMGFDPFAGENCNECGPLKESFLEDALAVADGDIDGVLESEKPDEPSDGFAPPGWLWALWMAGGFVGVGITTTLLRRREDEQWEDYPDERRLIRDLDTAIAEIGPGDYGSTLNGLLNTRQQLLDQIDERRKYGQTQARRMAHERLLKEASQTVDDFVAGNSLLKEKN